jgi:negative regulator of sigma E activity
MDPHDDLDEYLRGDSALSRQYRREAAPMTPHALDRRVLCAARVAQRDSPYLAPLAFAASVLLSVAMVLAIVFGPQRTKRAAPAPHVVRAAARVMDTAQVRAPSVWLADIAALRRAGRTREADAEFLRFRSAYPEYRVTEPGIANRVIVDSE